MGSYTNTQGSSQPTQQQQYGGGLYNPLYGQLAQMMMYGGGGYGGYSPFYGYGMPQQQQAFYQPPFWQSLLQAMYQPQSQPQQTATGYIPSTDYAQMVAQSNPGGRAVPGTAYVPPPPPPPPPPSPAASNNTTGASGVVDYSSLGIGGGGDGGGEIGRAHV